MFEKRINRGLGIQLKQFNQSKSYSLTINSVKMDTQIIIFPSFGLDKRVIYFRHVQKIKWPVGNPQGTRNILKNKKKYSDLKA